MVTTHSIKHMEQGTMDNKKPHINKSSKSALSILSFSVLSILSSIAVAQSLASQPSNLSSNSLNNRSNVTNDSEQSLSSCDIYNEIEQSDTPIDLSDITETPNGIKKYTNDLNLQVESFQPCKANKPFSGDKEATTHYQKLEQDFDKVTQAIMRDLPDGFSQYKELTTEDFDQIFQKALDVKESVYEPDWFINVYIYLAVNRYLGEFVPKDDAKAVQYLTYVVDYYQSLHPNELSPALNYMVAIAIMEKQKLVSDNNPIKLQSDDKDGVEAATAYLLSKAGHLDTKALLIIDYMDRVGSTLENPTQEEIHQLFDAKLEELTYLAEQGSYVATEALAEVYEELTAIDPSYTELAKYWNDRNKALPQSDIDWH